jgi:tetratricopeptide (TPR) repeat protein
MAINQLLELAEHRKFESILNVYQEYSLEEVAEVASFLREKAFYKVAMPLYTHLLERNEASDYHFGIGQCYGKSYNYSLSLWHLEKAFSFKKVRSGANYYAYILEKNYQNDRASEWYEKALKDEYGSDLWTLSHYAYFLEKDNQKNKAKEYYEQVLRLNPAYTWAIKRYALFLLNEKQTQQSLELMQAALEKFPQNLFVKLNCLEYLIICGMDSQYELYLSSLNYDSAPLPFQILIDLLDYFWRYLLKSQSNPEKIKLYELKTSQLKDGIHRDFDDLNRMLADKNGDLTQWVQLIQLLIS